jgi:hypothetical protein
MVANVDPLVGKYDPPGTYIVIGVEELSDLLRVGYFRGPGEPLRALALTTREYIRARELLKQGAEGVEIVRA